MSAKQEFEDAIRARRFCLRHEVQVDGGGRVVTVHREAEKLSEDFPLE